VKRIAASHKSPCKNQGEPVVPPFVIPGSWEWVRLGTVLQPLQSKLPQGEFFRYIDIDAIDNKNNVVEKPKCIAVSEAPSRASRGLKSGDTLFSLVRPYLRNIAYIDDSLEDCIASTGFYVCRPYEIDSRFLFKFLLSDYVVNGLNAFMKGDNSPSIRGDHIQSFLVPLPPLAEQKRIVAKIEELRTVIKSLTT
jgi:type I restriction enzyme S subunit